MAKKDFSFDDINSELKTLNPLGSIMSDSTFSEVTEWIDTGNFHLNACVSQVHYLVVGLTVERVQLQDHQERVKHS